MTAPQSHPMSHPFRLRRRYVDTAEGQLHLTECGDPAARPVVVMHWTPLSANQYLHELPVLAELGYRAIGVDCMGFGRSDRRPNDAVWSIERHAEAVKTALKAVGARQAHLAGGHFSTPIAVELSLDPSLEAASLSVDGGGLMPPEAIKAILAKARPATAQPGLHEDGSHRYFLFDQAVRTYETFAEGWRLSEETLPMLYRFIIDFLETGLPADMGSTVAYDIAGKLGQVTLPTLVLTAETEPLRPSYEPLIDAVKAGGQTPDCHEFPGDHPLNIPARAGEYARTLHRFLEAHGLSG